MIYMYCPTSNVPQRRASNSALNGVNSRGTKVGVGSRQDESRSEAGQERKEGRPMAEPRQVKDEAKTEFRAGRKFRSRTKAGFR